MSKTFEKNWSIVSFFKCLNFMHDYRIMITLIHCYYSAEVIDCPRRFPVMSYNIQYKNIPKFWLLAICALFIWDFYVAPLLSKDKLSDWHLCLRFTFLIIIVMVIVSLDVVEQLSVLWKAWTSHSPCKKVGTHAHYPCK